jgi:tRNA(Met) C34 N-acetyltransferase TmcA
MCFCSAVPRPLSLFLAGGWRILIVPPVKKRRKKETTAEEKKKKERTTDPKEKATRRVRDGEDERKSFEGNKFRNSKEVFDKRSTSSAQRSSQPQVTPSLDMSPFRKKSTAECLTMQEKMVFSFQKSS